MDHGSPNGPVTHYGPAIFSVILKPRKFPLHHLPFFFCAFVSLSLSLSSSSSQIQTHIYPFPLFPSSFPFSYSYNDQSFSFAQISITTKKCFPVAGPIITSTWTSGPRYNRDKYRPPSEGNPRKVQERC